MKDQIFEVAYIVEKKGWYVTERIIGSTQLRLVSGPYGSQEEAESERDRLKGV